MSDKAPTAAGFAGATVGFTGAAVRAGEAFGIEADDEEAADAANVSAGNRTRLAVAPEDEDAEAPTCTRVVRLEQKAWEC